MRFAGRLILAVSLFCSGLMAQECESWMRGLLPIAGVALGGSSVEGQKSLSMEVLAPCTKEPHPAAILIHRGGFTSGSSYDLNLLSLEDVLVSQGFAVFAIDYRLAPGASVSTMVSDVQRSVRYVRYNASRFNVDPHRIALVGDEAGGYLASIAALTLPQRGVKTYYDWDLESDAVQAVVVLAGAGEFGKRMLSRDGTEAHSPRGWSTAPASVSPSSEQASKVPADMVDPLSLVHSGAPPLLLIQGEGGEAPVRERGVKLIHALEAAGNGSSLLQIGDERQLPDASPDPWQQPLRWQVVMAGWLQNMLAHAKTP